MRRTGRHAAEQALFKRAIALDPTLHLPTRNRHQRANEAILCRSLLDSKGYDLRDQTTERERMSIEIAYNVYATRTMSAINSMRLYNSIYPNNASIWFELSKTYYWSADQDAVEAENTGIAWRHRVAARKYWQCVYAPTGLRMRSGSRRQHCEGKTAGACIVCSSKWHLRSMTQRA